MTNPYQIFKCALLDISLYIQLGVKYEDIESVLQKIFHKRLDASYRLIDYVLMYEIRTIFVHDEDLIKLLDDIVTELDILLVNSKENNIIYN